MDKAQIQSSDLLMLFEHHQYWTLSTVSGINPKHYQVGPQNKTVYKIGIKHC